MERIIKFLICIALLSISSISALYISKCEGNDYSRYAKFKNECYVLNEKGETITDKVINVTTNPYDSIVLCDKLIIQNDSEINERYKVLVKMNYYPDISLFLNSEVLNYDNSQNAYVSQFFDLDSQQKDINNLSLQVGSNSINENMTIEILIEQKD